MKITGGLRFKRCPDCDELHDQRDWPDNHRRPEEAISAPMVIRDSMPAIQSQVDGSWHESKRGIRKTYEASGNREGVKYIEVGDDPQRNKPFQRKSDRKGIRDSVQKATAQLRNGQVTEKTYRTKVINRPGPI